ncbi:MAG: DUF92 domain-containing protein [Candidatus Brocadia sinica]|nr:DUF92 domain-containing protein [Candidatus Brocadia sinica]NUO04637.1 DUF92 domain-containing protein [Candidatus Brocadia sinica]
MTNETKRRIEHIVPVIFVFLLKYLNTWQALLFALAGILYGLFLSKIFVKGSFREHEMERGFSFGKLIYGVMVFALILLFHKKMYIVAGAWAIMSLGDGCSNLFGKTYGKKKLPWNPEKSWIGFIAFVFFGGLGAAILMWWVNLSPLQTPLPWHYLLITAFLTSFITAGVESLPLKIDDNITVPLAAGLFLYAATIVNWKHLSHAHNIFTAFSVNVAFGLLAYYVKTVNKSGLISGVVLGTIIYLCLGPGGFLILFTFFLLGSWSSRYKYTWKASHGVAQENKGKRSSKHVIAKGGVGLVMAVMALLTNTPEIYRAAFVAAFATATFDTISSELGQIYGKRPILITTMQPVPVGTDGAISVEGTILGILSAAFIGAEAYVLHVINLQSILIVIIASFVGTTVESILGATIERRKWISNEVVNFINISTGTIVSLFFAKICLS